MRYSCFPLIIKEGGIVIDHLNISSHHGQDVQKSGTLSVFLGPPSSNGVVGHDVPIDALEMCTVVL